FMIIISGASRGIGKYLLEKYIAEGQSAIGIYNKTKPTTQSDRYVQVDVTNEQQVIDFVSKHKEQLKDIRFVHCAGVNLNGFTHKLSLDDWRFVMQGNLDSAFLMAKHLLPLMREQNYGRLVFVASVVPQLGVPGTSAYSGSKAGLWGLMKVISKENALKGITANCLNLGYYNIGMISEVPEDMMKVVLNTIPMKKLGDPINIYNAMQFVFESDYITGTEININGGLI
ncbi:SDR family oxidoreductase, partial [bacterium]|nr:SDR family oxidoreductase [bacterium]